VHSAVDGPALAQHEPGAPATRTIGQHENRVSLVPDVRDESPARKVGLVEETVITLDDHAHRLAAGIDGDAHGQHEAIGESAYPISPRTISSRLQQACGQRDLTRRTAGLDRSRGESAQKDEQRGSPNGCDPRHGVMVSFGRVFPLPPHRTRECNRLPHRRADGGVVALDLGRDGRGNAFPTSAVQRMPADHGIAAIFP